LPAAQPFVRAAKIDVDTAVGDPIAADKLIKLADYTNTGGLHLETLAFVLLRAWGATGSQWRTLFETMGYSKSLQPSKVALPFVVALHASQDIPLLRCTIPPDVYDRVLCAYCKKHGQTQRLGSAAVYSLGTDSGAIFVGENTGNAAVQISVDCTGSSNVEGYAGALRGSSTVAPPPQRSRGGQLPELLLAIAQKNVDEAYSWQYRCHTGAPPSKMAYTARPVPLVPLGMVLEHLIFPETLPPAEQALQVAAKEVADQDEAKLRARDSELIELSEAYDQAAASNGKLRPLPKALPTRPLSKAIGAGPRRTPLPPPPPGTRSRRGLPKLNGRSTSALAKPTMQSEPEPALLLAIQADESSPPTEWHRANLDAISQLACSHYHSVAISRNGSVYSWGRGPYGVLGHGTEEDEPVGRRIAALDGASIVGVAAGPFNSAAVTADGKVLLWGWQPLGTLEEGVIEETLTTVPVNVPVPLPPTRRVMGVACGCFAVAAWDVDGNVYTWGRGDSGQLGHGTVESVALPRPVEALAGVQVEQVAFGGVQEQDIHTGFMVLASASGAIFSCGNPSRGRLGRPFSTDDDDYFAIGGKMADMGSVAPVHYALPGQVLGDLYNERDGNAVPIAKVSASDGHAAVLSDAGLLFVWGCNQAWARGAEVEDIYASDVEEPTHVSDAPPLIDITCSAFVTLGLTSRGEAVLLGGDFGAKAMPRRVRLPGAAVSIYGGGYYLGVLVDFGSMSTELPVQVVGPRGAYAGQMQDDSAKLLASHGLPPELAESLEPTIAAMLLADVGHVPPEQIRHELRLLRDLLRAEKAKLHALVHMGEEQDPPPSAGTWTDKPGTRQGTRGDSQEMRGHVREVSARKPHEAKYTALVAETKKMDPRANLSLFESAADVKGTPERSASHSWRY